MAAIGLLPPINMVYPSGRARATDAAPRLPAAPLRFSTTNGWPKALCSSFATARAMMSLPPPGA